MFDVGFSELVLLFVIGLLILGPERLPRVASQLGRWIGRARRTAHQLRMQIEREMTMNDIMRDQREAKRDDAKSTIHDPDKAADGEQDAAAESTHHDAEPDQHAQAVNEVRDAEHAAEEAADAVVEAESAKPKIPTTADEQP